MITLTCVRSNANFQRTSRCAGQYLLVLTQNYFRGDSSYPQTDGEEWCSVAPLHTTSLTTSFFRYLIGKFAGLKILTFQENFSIDYELAMNYSMACKECPDYLYDYDNLRDHWQRFCLNMEPTAGLQAKSFFKTVFNQHLKSNVFVTAFDCSNVAKLFVDYNVYCKIKEKLERRVGLKVPQEAPVRITKRRLPCVKHMFASNKDMEKCIENLKRKNEEIAFQMEVRGIRLFQTIQSNLAEQARKVLALDLELYEDDPTRILEIGFTLFRMHASIEQGCHVFKCRHIIIKENQHLFNKDIFPDNRNKFNFGTTQFLCFSRAKSTLKAVLSEAEIITAHSAANLTDYLRERGVDLPDIVDTRLLYLAAFPSAKHQQNLARILNELHIKHDYNNNFLSDQLHNAGNDAYYTMEIFKELVWKGLPSGT
ncbi:uncharacterized protein LOC5507893 isoform X1 [Nematostella vectensis]|uniref:uncharacterized protein LOC5507893 isoform X1 n=1 Tax=Nematostella vectensis TaxID=45351 RepID=UPI00138FD988|nr:uncharacterized protein LOC5507893 isoform X1 [Nematostella vectensis]